MSSRIFTAPAILTSCAFSKDGGLRLGFATNELSNADKVIVAEYHGKFGTVAFREGDIEAEDLPDAKPSDERKTPSQRLRDVLFVLWKQEGSKGDFDAFYRKHLDRAIERVKNLLD